jgi:hypothetical protein
MFKRMKQVAVQPVKRNRYPPNKVRIMKSERHKDTLSKQCCIPNTSNKCLSPIARDIISAQAKGYNKLWFWRAFETAGKPSS